MGKITDINGNYVGEVEADEIFGKPFICVYGKTKPRNWDETVVERPVAEGLTAYVRFEASDKVIDVISKGDQQRSGGTIMVKRAIIEHLGIDEDTLFQQAIENTILKIEDINALLGIFGEACPMVVVRSDKDIYGAGILANKAALETLRDKYGAFTIIPSSVHEVIILPDSVIPHKTSDIAKMVKEVNATVVVEADQLSDNVYRYDAEGLHVAQ